MDYLKKTNIALICLLLLNLSCTSVNRKIQEFNRDKKAVEKEFVPDHTLNVFEAELVRENGRWLLQGETTLKSAQEEMLLLTDRLLGENRYQNQMVLLPDKNVFPKQYGIVRVSTAQLRAHPARSSELMDQVIIGQNVRLLKQQGDWLLVQTGYDYIGWIRPESLFRMDLAGLDRWRETKKIRVISNYAVMYSEPDHHSAPITDLSLNAELEFLETQGKWTRVSTPDSQKGFIETSAITDAAESALPVSAQRELVIKTAVSMTGVSYLWGGNSSKANDCSGFVQTVFKARGIQLPRDARQQALEGADVVYSPDYSELMPGDLLFFGQGDNVTHVGISLGGPRFIHQSGSVHVNSLDPDDADFQLSSKKSLLKVKRIIREVDQH